MTPAGVAQTNVTAYPNSHKANFFITYLVLQII